MRWRVLCLIPVVALAADPTWRDKSPSKWDANDAKQILADSPWVKHPTPHWLADLSPFQREEGGDLNAGVGKGVGIAGLGILGSRREAEAIKAAHNKPLLAPVTVHWESAMPVRFAEHLIGDTTAPELKGDDYAIAVYDIQTPKKMNTTSMLKDTAFLRRPGRKDIKASRAIVLRPQDADDDMATIVYFFPGSVEIAKREGMIEFTAQIGRFWLSQFFDTREMQLRGDPQLLLPDEGPH